MRKLFIPFIIGIFLTFSTNVKSQSLGVDSMSNNLLSLPDTINLNDNYSHTITVQNKSAVLLTGNIYLIAAVDTAGTLNSIDTVGTAQVTNFGLGDTIGISYNEIYNSINGYKLGSNIVVVWPIANFGTTSDTLTKNVYILSPLAINEDNLLRNQIIIYPNPAKDVVFIKNNSIKNKVKHVRIIDLNGRLIYNGKSKSKINISFLPKGIYILKIGLKEEELHYKLIKE